jgi:hypothetical protein
MKYFYMLLFMVGTFCYGIAQITIDASDAPEIGTVLSYAEDTILTNIDPGPDGMGQSWDFTGFDADVTFVTNVIDPATTPSADLFPTAALVLETNGFYSYASIDEVGLYGLGGSAEQEGVVVTAALDPAQLLLQNPTTFGTTFDSEFRLFIEIDGSDFGVDSVRIQQLGSASSEVTASGTLSVPAGDFETLRLRTETVTIDSVWIKFFGTWLLFQDEESTSITYEWWGEDGVSIVATLETDVNGNPLDLEYLTNYAPPALAPVANFEFEVVEAGTVQFTDLSTNAPNAWEWDLGDGNTSIEQNPEHTYAVSGDYEVCLIATNNAGSNTTCQEVNIVISSDEEVNQAQMLRLYPNPAQNWLILEADAASGKAVEAWIFNMLGQREQVLRSQAMPANWNIDITPLQQGTYLLILRIEDSVEVVSTFVKE